MKWFQDNPVGLVLASIGGFFLLLILVMAIVWNLPVSVETADTGGEVATGGKTTVDTHQLGNMDDYLVINQKPVFNESRQPVTDEIVDSDEVEDTTIEVKDAPAVKLTGVVITPDARLASLTPEDKKIEAVMAREGDSLTGAFVGWRLAMVHPRGVVLESRDGQSLALELEVNDATIKEPPKIKTAAPVNQALSGQDAEAGEQGEEPLSRAEQIRQRIAERREELRREQEERAGEDVQQDTANQPAKPSYQSAIRALMNKSKDKGSNDNQDG